MRKFTASLISLLIFWAIAIGFAVLNSAVAEPVAKPSADGDPVATTTQALTREILSHGKAYSDLAELVAGGPRLSGSTGAANAITWGKKKMESYGFDRVWLQPVRVPKWERGKTEIARALIKGRGGNLKITALGGSVATPKGGLEAMVLEVHSLDEVTALGEKVKGKIVFFNRPMDPEKVNTFEAYGGASDQRFSGPARASKYGAVAALVRSMTLKIDDHPHTGATHFKDGVQPIPAAALSTNDAEKLSALLRQDANLKVHLELSARPLGMVDSFNVIGELSGRELPNEIITVGGHLDSWDLGPGAHDDGAGVVQSIEALRAIRALGLRPRRTLRAVLFMAEEVGGLGGEEYARQAKAGNEKHAAAMESDNGGFTPLGFVVHASEKSLSKLRSWGKYLAPIHADFTRMGHAETDIEPLSELGVPLFGLTPDSQRYFDHHHSATDTLENVNPRELGLGAAAMSILTWLISEQGI